MCLFASLLHTSHITHHTSQCIQLKKGAVFAQNQIKTQNRTIKLSGVLHHSKYHSCHSVNIGFCALECCKVARLQGCKVAWVQMCNDKNHNTTDQQSKSLVYVIFVLFQHVQIVSNSPDGFSQQMKVNWKVQNQYLHYDM